MWFESGSQPLMAEAHALPENRRNAREVRDKQHNNHLDSNQDQDQKAVPDQRAKMDILVNWILHNFHDLKPGGKDAKVKFIWGFF